MTVITRNNRWPLIQAQLRLANRSTVAVGFPGEAPSSKAGASNHNGMNNVQVAIANEVGSAPGVRPEVPSRPFMKQTFNAKRSAKFMQTLQDLLGGISRGQMSTKIALERIGRMGQTAVVNEIDTGVFAPNSPRTVAVKGSSKPLVDTGAMRQAVTYKVRMRGSRGVSP